jgi:signal peptidase I
VFDFLLSEEKKMRRHAANWLEVAERVWHFRRDQLAEAQGQRLAAATGELRTRLKEKADASRLKLAIEKLEGVLRETGGRQYPMGSLAENVEFFLVAALVILGLRAYFVQPFKIPTNSMWPSYYGMTHELTPPGAEPGPLTRAARLVAYGATHHAVLAPADGEVYVPVVAVNQSQPRFVYLGSETAGRFLGVFPSANKEWTFLVGGETAKFSFNASDAAFSRLSTPADFDFERVLEEKLAGPRGNLSDFLLERARQAGRNPESSIMTFVLGGQRRDLRVYWLPTGLKVRKGEPIVSFDLLTGDLLFVDRITYNFLPPKVGQGFVFKTENIHGPEMEDAAGSQIRQYYIKRLVGTPGDTVEIRSPQLLRNGAPITGADAFGWNARQTGLYPGYANERLLAAGQQMTVPEHSYLALGDNSPRSKDSRYWGYVPEKDVVGKPLFIYYPLSRRWGVAN